MFRIENRLLKLILFISISISLLLALFTCSIVPDQYQTLSSYQINYTPNFPAVAPAIDCSGSMSSQTVSEGLDVNLSSNGFACVGYHLIGWTTQGAEGGVELALGGTVSIGDSDLTLYGVWATNDEVVLRYDNNYQFGFDWGPTSLSPVIMLMNSYTTMAGNPFTMESHIFLGWSENASATTADYSDGAVFTIGLEDVTLYAVWLLNPQYPLYFNANDGAAIPAEISQDFRESETKTIDPNTFVYSGVSAEGILNIVETGGRTFKGWRWTAAGLPTNIDLLDSDTYTYPAPGVVDPGDLSGTAPKLFAVWEDNPVHTITYKIDDGYGSDSIQQTFFEGEEKGLLPFASTGFSPNASAPQNFSGWALVSTNDLTKVIYSDEQSYTMGSGDITLYGVWTNSTYQTISYNANGGDGLMSNQVLPQGVNASLISNAFSMPGYNFTGWSITPAPAFAAAADHSDGAAINLSADLNLYAIWTVNSPVKITYTNNFPDGGSTTPAGTMSIQQIAEGATANLTANGFTRTGYTFAGWARSAPSINDLSSVSLSDGQSYYMAAATGDFTLYAVWKSDSYTATFNDNIVATPAVMNFPSDQTVYFDKEVSNPPQPSRAGYNFLGWYREAALTTSWNFLTDTINTVTVPSGTVLTLYASWTPKNYTISYNSQGGTSITSFSGDFGTIVTAPAASTKTGYTFAGWYTDYPSFSNSWTFGTDTIEGNQTLYAQWTANPYTITYDGNTNDGGTVPGASGTSYDYDISVTVAGNTFTKTGNYFTGWNTAANGTGVTYAPNIAFQMKFTANTTLYAQWNENTNRLIYDGNTATAGSTPLGSGVYHDYNATVVVDANTFIKTGYIFTGWNTSSDGSGVMYKKTGDVAAVNNIVMNNPSADITLYAQWEIGSSITITLPTEASDGYIHSGEKSESVSIFVDNADQACYKLGSVPVGPTDGTVLTNVNGVANIIPVNTLTGITEGSVQIYVFARKNVGTEPFDITKSSTLFIYDITQPVISTFTMPTEMGDGYINNAEKNSVVFIQTTGAPYIVRAKVGGMPADINDGTRVTEGAGVVALSGIDGISEGGSRQVFVKVWDYAGNEASATSASFVYDITAPTPPSITLPALAGDGWINLAEKDEDVVFGTTTGGPSIVRAQFGSTPATTTAGMAILIAGISIDTSTIPGLSEGAGQTIYLRTWDTAGNYADAISGSSFNYDITPPTAPTITLPASLNDGYANIADAANNIVVTGSADFANLTYKWMAVPTVSSDGTAIATPTTGHTAAVNAYTGITSGVGRSLYVGAWDAAGNRSFVSSGVFVYDYDLPVISISLPTAFDPGVGTPHSTTGTTALAITGSADRWINAAEKDSLITFTSSDITAGVGGLTVRCSASSMPASISDGIGIDAGTGTIPVSSIPGIVEARSKQIFFKAFDSAGNEASGTSLTFGYDITAPTGGSITDFIREGSLNRDREVTYSNATDTISDYTSSQIAYMVSSKNGSKPDFGTHVDYWGNHSNTSHSVNCPFSPEYGTKYVRVWAVDEAGNTYYFGYKSK